MNKRYILLLFVFLGLSHAPAKADGNPQISFGFDEYLKVLTTNAASLGFYTSGCSASDYISMQCDLYLPPFMSLEEDGEGNVRYDRGNLLHDNHTVIIRKRYDAYFNRYRVIIYGSEPETHFQDSRGEFIHVNVNVSTYGDGAPTGGESQKLANWMAVQGEVLGKCTKDEEHGLAFSADRPGVFYYDADWPIEDFTLLDENSTAAVASSTDAQTVIVKRTINAGEWSTFVLPINCSGTDLFNALGEDAEFAMLSGVEFDEEGSMLVKFSTFYNSSKGITWKDYLAGGYKVTPPEMPDKWQQILIVRTTKDVKEMRFDNATITPNNRYEGRISKITTVDDTQYNLVFRGTYNYIDNETNFYNSAATNYILFLSGNKFYYSAKKVKMKGFRGYFYGSAVEKAVADDKGATIASAPRISYVIDGETTGINEEIRVESEEFNSPVYTLSGQEVSLPSLPKGIYIKSGKKFVVK